MCCKPCPISKVQKKKKFESILKVPRDFPLFDMSGLQQNVSSPEVSNLSTKIHELSAIVKKKELFNPFQTL